uniref:HlyC/CorC family transporter n=1 Tax=Anaerolinea thermolimosa TaxID=229919 RepID=A0A7C4KG25_9CHLR
MTLGQILLILILISLNAFFVGVEFAAVTSRRTRLEVLSDANSPAARRVAQWLENDASRDRLIAAAQLGTTLVSLALGAAGENSFEAWLAPFFHNLLLPAQLRFLQGVISVLPLVLSLVVITSLHVVLGEQVPKVAVIRNPERFALVASGPMHVFTVVFRSFIDLLDWATRSILRLIGMPQDGHAHAAVSSLEELRQIVSSPEVEKIVEPPEREMLSAVIDFSGLLVRQVMIPRTEIVAAEANTPLSEVIRLAVQEGVTKIPVYEENLDQVTGVIHLRDLMARWLQDELRSGVARDLVREVLFIPDSLPVNDLLVQFRQGRQHIAIVLDEYGGTAGLVTLEDLLEEIVGVVQDPFDRELPEIQPQPDGSALLDGLMLIEEVNATFGLHLEDPNYDTIAGYILGKLGHIPQPGEMVEVPEENVRLRVESMDRLRIARVSLSKLSSEKVGQ